MKVSELSKEQLRKFKRAIKSGKINVVGVKQTSNGWTGFRLFMQDGTQICIQDSPYYSKTKGYYHCTAWGTDRRLEVVLSVGYALGLGFHDISQQYRWLSWER
jgi:hypothetical protein